jgi:hypothetical protein
MKSAIVVALIIVGVATAVFAKGLTTRITLRDTTLDTSIDITDPSVLGAFNVWAGPGTYSNGVEGTHGFIIDWAAGIARDRPNGPSRYEVMFYVRFANRSTEELAYVVLYERDPASRRGFVYLPGRSEEHYGRNVKAILRHNLEGHWFHATEAWDNAVNSWLSVH